MPILLGLFSNIKLIGIVAAILFVVVLLGINSHLKSEIRILKNNLAISELKIKAEETARAAENAQATANIKALQETNLFVTQADIEKTNKLNMLSKVLTKNTACKQKFFHSLQIGGGEKATDIEKTFDDLFKVN